MTLDNSVIFEILMREQTDMLLVYLRAVVRDGHLVDDLFQETMLVAWRNLHRFDRSRPLGPWLRGIAAKLVLAQRRKDARKLLMCDEQILEALDHRMQTLSSQPGDTLDEKLDGLRGCLEQLANPYREVIRLRYGEQLLGEAIAEKLQLSTEALKKRLQRARDQLLPCLQSKFAAAAETTT